MKAVVLVGGQGTRLRPLTLSTPKQMLPVGDRPMIEHVVEHLARHGVEEVVLSLGFRPDAFLAAYPSGRCAGVPLRYAVEDEPLDTAGAIAFAAAEAGITGTFVAVNGDVLTGLDVAGLVAFHRSRPALATIHLTPVDDPSRFGVVASDEGGRVLAFIEKPPAGTAPTNLINAGTYVLEPEALAGVAPGRRVSIERDTFPALVAGGSLYAMASEVPWLDIGTPATYLAANLRFAGPAAGGSDIDPTATVTGSVLGAGCVVAAGAVVTASLLLPGAKVGPGATVSGSILGTGASVGPGAAVRDLSVIGDGITVAARAVVSGERIPQPVG